MAFIEKKDPVVLNIKLTTKGRQMLSQGKLDFKYFAIGDSEIDYNLISDIKTVEPLYTPFNSSILKPVDTNPKIISIIPKNTTADTYNLISNVPNSWYPVVNPVESIGFFTNVTANTFTFVTSGTHVKQPDAMVEMSKVTGGTKLYLKKAPTYGTSASEPAVGDFIMIKYTISAHTTGHTTTRVNASPYLIYQISGIISGTLGNDNLVISVDRNIPNFTGFNVSTLKAGAVVFYNYSNYTGDTLSTNYSTEYLETSTLSFQQNSQCDTTIFPFWNMSILYTEDIAGVATSGKSYGQYHSRIYAGIVSYIQNQKPIYKKLGVIHYTNSSPANVYGEGFYLKTPILDIPTIMWHKSTDKKLGVRLTTGTLFTGTTNTINSECYNLIDPSGNVVGKVFTDLKIFIIEDQELLFAMSHKSNRSWTLPDYTSGY